MLFLYTSCTTANFHLPLTRDVVLEDCPYPRGQHLAQALGIRAYIALGTPRAVADILYGAKTWILELT